MPEPHDRAYADFAVGDHVWFTRRFDAADFEAFASLSGDRNPLHHDREYAAGTSFEAPIVPLHLAAAPFSAMVGMMLPGRRALYLSHELKARRPVPFDTEVTYSARVTAKQDARRTLDLSAIAFAGDEVLLEGRLLAQVRDDERAAAPATSGDGAVARPARRRRALVTGATGVIGRATARALARAGFDLALQHRQGADVAALAEACRVQGGDVACHAADLADAGDLAGLISALSREASLTDVVHCASPPIDAGLDALMAVNFAALRTLGRALIPDMLKAQQGRFLLVGSSAVQHNPRGWENYVAAKAAASQWAEGLNARHGRWGITGLIVAPGFVETPFSADHRPPGASALMPEQVAEAIVGQLEGPGPGRGSYLWLEPEGARAGHFGFRGEASRASPLAPGEPARAASRDGAQPAANGADVMALVGMFFGLGPQADLANAGVDRLPGWDSLRHIELMLFLEERLGIRFQASEIERTTDLARLTALVAEKQNAGRAMPADAT